MTRQPFLLSQKQLSPQMHLSSGVGRQSDHRNSSKVSIPIVDMMNSRTSENITLVAAIVGCVTGVIALVWQIYESVTQHDEDVVLEWNFEPNRDLSFYQMDEDGFPVHYVDMKAISKVELNKLGRVELISVPADDESIFVKATNLSSVSVFPTEFSVHHEFSDCFTAMGLHGTKETFEKIAPGASAVFSFPVELPGCTVANILDDNSPLTIKLATSRGNTFEAKRSIRLSEIPWVTYRLLLE